MSPDTDMYHIGIALQSTYNKHVIVQISSVSSWPLQLIDLFGLKQALNNDFDLANLNPSLLGDILQALYVVSGCDYIHFFLFPNWKINFP